MDCLETKKNLAAYLDDLLEGRDAEALEAHLFDCAGCRNERERVERLFAFAAVLPEASPPPRVWEKVRAAIRAPQPAPWDEKWNLWIERVRESWMRFTPSYLAGAASAALLLIFVLPLTRENTDKTGLQKENGSPQFQAGLVPSPMTQERNTYGDAYPVRYIGGNPAAPGKRLVVRDGQLFEVEEPPAQPRVDYPVRDIGTHAVLRRDF